MARVVDTARNSRLLLGALVLGHLILISHQVDAGGGASLLERMVFTALTPFQRLVAGAVRGVGSAWQGYVDLRGVRDENRRLRERVDSLETELQRRREQAEQTERLRELLGLKRILPFDTLTAQVIARDGLPFFHTLTLDKGLDAGLALNAPVLSATGVVGRIVALGPKAAKVQVLLDRDCGVGVVVERSRVMGVVSGQLGSSEGGATDLLMKYVGAAADVRPADVVVTSGMDRIFPKGLMVGRVRWVGERTGLFKDVLVTPSAGFDRLEEVLVVTTPLEPAEVTQTVRAGAVR